MKYYNNRSNVSNYSSNLFNDNDPFAKSEYSSLTRYVWFCCALYLTYVCRRSRASSNASSINSQTQSFEYDHHLSIYTSNVEESFCIPLIDYEPKLTSPQKTQYRPPSLLFHLPRHSTKNFKKNF